jgi:hypothetical protein
VLPTRGEAVTVSPLASAGLRTWAWSRCSAGAASSSATNDGDPGTATTAAVGYFDGERVRTVRTANVIMAYWTMVIPYLVDELPSEQKQALRGAVKVPLVYSTVQLHNWEAWQRVGVSRTRFTGAYVDTAITAAYRAVRELQT